MKKKNQNLIVSIMFLVLFVASLIYYFSVSGVYWLFLSVLAVSGAIFAFITYLYDLSERKQFLIVGLFFILFGLMYFVMGESKNSAARKDFLRYSSSQFSTSKKAICIKSIITKT